jgi:hypothetical protein
MSKIIIVILVGVSFLIGCKESTKQTMISVAVKGDPNAKIALDELTRENMFIIDPNTGDKFFIVSVEPKSDVDYKKVSIKPDPNVDYTIEIIGPQLPPQMSQISRELAEAIQRQMQKDSTKPHP